jgi:hypothetical protein
MRRGVVVALNGILLLGLATVARAAEPADNDATAPSGGWFTRWFSFGKKAPEMKAAEKSKEATPAPSKAMLLQAAAAQRAQEEAALLRRQGVCLKLRMIAAQTNDEELRRKADQLDERAWNSYVQRTAHLPNGDAGPASDEAVLARHLGSAGASPAGSTRGSSSSGHAAARGEVP